MIDFDSIPTSPGCYLFKDHSGKIIYVGKAKNLKKRVKQYFSNKDLDIKTKSLVSNINSVEFIATNNEVESLILENNIIKKNQPKYNINLKDSKNYAYIEITDEIFPRFITSRGKCKGKCFGPFTSGYERQNLFDFVNKTFQLRTCTKLPKKPCLRYHIKLCTAPCINNVTKEEYLKQINSAMFLLSGKDNELLMHLKQNMKLNSDQQNYEVANLIKNQIIAIENLKTKQNMQRDKKYDEDIINYLVVDETIYLMLFNIKFGTLINKRDFIFNYSVDFIEQFLTQYYSENDIPKELILPVDISTGVKEYLSLNKKVIFTVPKKGDKLNLLNLVLKNIEISFFGDIRKLEYIKDELKLNDLPLVIECFDISHLSGTSTVGSMVQFRNAKADKNNYRRFKIKTVTGIDDFSSIAEVVRRRYGRLVFENTDLPNLIIIDGGIGQLNAALNELTKLNLKIPIISIAKKFEEIYFPNISIPLRLDSKNKARLFIQQIRDEAHRFAISYNRLLRKKSIENDQ